MGYIATNASRLSPHPTIVHSSCRGGRYLRAYQPTQSHGGAFNIGITRKQQIYTHLARNFTSATTRRAGKPAAGRQTAQQQPTKDAFHKTAETRDAAVQVVRLKRAAEIKTKVETEKANQKEYQKRYQSAARKWVSTMIALPILLVTSYYLFDRRKFTMPQARKHRKRATTRSRTKLNPAVALGNEPKTLSKVSTTASRRE